MITNEVLLIIGSEWKCNTKLKEKRRKIIIENLKSYVIHLENVLEYFTAFMRLCLLPV